MSDVAQVALITGGKGFLSLLMSLWFNSRTRHHDLEQRASERHEDHQEWYNRTLFERRLDALSTEYSWLMKLNRLQAEVEKGNPAARPDLTNCQNDAREWYAYNTMLIFDTFPSSSDFIGAFNAAGTPGFHQQLNDALKSHRKRADRFMSRGGHDGR